MHPETAVDLSQSHADHLIKSTVETHGGCYEEVTHHEETALLIKYKHSETMPSPERQLFEQQMQLAENYTIYQAMSVSIDTGVADANPTADGEDEVENEDQTGPMDVLMED